MHYLIKRTFVSTDSKIIKRLAISFSAEVPFLRPKELASDTAPTLSVIKHALDYFEQKNQYFDAVCILQVTSPNRSVQFLNDSIKKFISSNCDSLISVRELPAHYNPHWVFKENKDGHLSIATNDEKIITRRQDLPRCYFRDGAIYISKHETIFKKNSILGSKISYSINPVDISINIDTIKDWKIAEKYFSKVNNEK